MRDFVKEALIAAFIAVLGTAIGVGVARWAEFATGHYHAEQ